MLHVQEIFGECFCANRRGTCVRTCANTGNLLEEFFHPWYQYKKHVLRGATFVRVHVAHVFAGGRIQENLISFEPGYGAYQGLAQKI